MDLGFVSRAQSDVERTLPSSNEAEQGYLCSLLLNAPRVLEACEIKSECLHNPAHRTLLETIVGLSNAGRPYDIISLTAELQKTRQLSAVGGPAYLAELQSLIPTWANAPYYAEVIMDMHHRRQLIRASGKLYETAYDDPQEIENAVDDLGATVKGWRDNSGVAANDPTDQKAWFDLIDDLDNRYERNQRNELQGIPTGIRWINQMTQGLQPETFYIIAGRPSFGKSALLSQIQVASSRSMRLKDGRAHKSLVLSLEMSPKKWRERMLAQDGVTTAGALKAGLFSELELSKFPGVIQHFRDTCFIFAGQLTLSEIRAAIRATLKKHPDLDWIGIDYLQSVKPENSKKNANRENDVANITRGLNNLKNEFGLPVICCVALNRGPEGRKEQRPRLSDSRDSGMIEYDVDTAFLLHMEENDGSLVREGSIICAKNRDGGLDERDFHFCKKHLVFREGRPENF